MFSDLLSILKDKIALAANSVLPAFIFACALISYYYTPQFEDQTIQGIHILFYLLYAVSLGVLLHFNQNRPLFFITTIVLGYFFIAILRKNLGEDYVLSTAYANLCVLIPFNLIIVYFLPNKTLINRRNAYALLLIFIQLTIAEQLSKNGISLNYKYPDFPLISVSNLMFIAMIIIFFINSSINGRINTSAMFFSSICVAVGFFYSRDTSGLAIFFFAAMLIMTLSIIKNIYYTTYKDVLTGLESRNSYIINSKKLPLKYSIGIVSIDNYDKLLSVFGTFGTNNITKMIANKIKELEGDNPIYRYSDDEFLLVFNNEPKEVAFERLEAIRKSIASSEFQINRRAKALKLTISGSITEKKRSDAGPMEVFKRAKKALQNTNQFAQNFTSRA